MDTKVAFFNNEILSFSENTHWGVGGVETRYGFGATFNMNTGELITLNYFINLNINQFRDSIGDFLVKKFAEWDGEDEDYFLSKIDDLEEKLHEMEYEDYEYYYDGAAVNIILNEMVFNNGCYVLKWDLQSGTLSEVHNQGSSTV